MLKLFDIISRSNKQEMSFDMQQQMAKMVAAVLTNPTYIEYSNEVLNGKGEVNVNRNGFSSSRRSRASGDSNSHQLDDRFHATDKDIFPFPKDQKKSKKKGFLGGILGGK